MELSKEGQRLTRRVREQSQRKWNEWVGEAKMRERFGYAIGLFGLIFGTLALLNAWLFVQKVRVVPPLVIAVDKYGQEVDRRRFDDIRAPDDLVERSLVARLLGDVFDVVDSADALARQYNDARLALVPGSHAWEDVQRYWDQGSPLGHMPDGTLRIVRPVKETAQTRLTSFLKSGKTSDGADVIDAQWSTLYVGSDATERTTTWRGRFEIVRPKLRADASQAGYDANPYGFYARTFSWAEVSS